MLLLSPPIQPSPALPLHPIADVVWWVDRFPSIKVLFFAPGQKVIKLKEGN